MHNITHLLWMRSLGHSTHEYGFPLIHEFPFNFKIPHLFIYFEIEGRQTNAVTNAKAQGAIHHLASFPSSREEISQLGIKPPTSSLRFGYLFTTSGSLGSSQTKDSPVMKSAHVV